MSVWSAPGLEALAFDTNLRSVLRLASWLRLGGRARHAVWSFLAALAMVGGLAAAVAALRPAPGSHARAAKQDAAWIDVAAPLRFYALESAEFGREPRLYAARRNVAGGGREDTLAFGPASPGDEPSLRLAIYRIGQEAAPHPRFFVDMARLAAQAGLAVTHSAQPGGMATRFGAFETADISLTSPRGEAACLGYRLEAPAPGLRIAGYACGAPGRPMDRRTLACVLDRLDLVSAGDDQPLARFFVAAEQGRGEGCGGQRGRVQKTSWLDPGVGKPPLRGGDIPRKPPSRR